MKKFNFKKTAASIAAFTLVFAAAVSPNASLISELVPVNSISASAATELTSGSWKYVETGTYTCEVTGYTGTTAKVTIPVAINGHTVTSIGTGAFSSNKTITYVAIPKGVKEIKNNTFKGASNLTSVILPSGITKIGNYAFQDTKISSISLPSGLTSIGSCAFKNTKLTSVTLPASVSSIGTTAFAGTPITSITIPSKVTSINAGTFENCTKLTKVSLPSSLKSICVGAFQNCTSLKSITIPDSVTNIYNSAFQNCTAMTDVKLPSSLKSITNTSFQGCTSVTMLTLPNSLDGINYSAFKDFKASYVYNIDLTKLDQYNANYDHHYEQVIQQFKYLNTVNGINMFSTTNGVMKPNSKVMAAIRVLDDNERVNKYITQEANKVVAEVTNSSMTDYQKAKALHDWVCAKVDYDYDEVYAEKNHVDSSIFLNDKTVCDGFARGYNLLLQAAGIESYYVMKTSVHAWNIVKLGGHYFHIDTCHDNKTGNNFDLDHYALSDAKLKKVCSSHDPWYVSKPTSLYNYASNKATPTCKYSIGDINKDGKVDNADQNYLLNYVVNNKGYTISASDKVLADTNFDGKVDICDATAINKFKD
ncbi:MAG: hypothetical protein E7497_01540 [Ruminococcus sp.]|nr:hypothetical protein [Ruminococcus sp.]